MNQNIDWHNTLKTFVEKNKDLIKPGALYYPFCGFDTRAFLTLFYDNVNEFHFADVMNFETLKFKAKNEVLKDKPETKELIEDNSKKSNPILVESCKFLTLDIFPIKKINNIESKYNYAKLLTSFIIDNEFKSSVYMNDLNKSFRYIEKWEIEGKPLSVYWHRFDALVALADIDNISVFVYLGDSYWEDGSRQFWLHPVIFNELLTHLADDALIITDGSNTKHNSVFQPWAYFLDDYYDQNITDFKLFYYRNHKFTLLVRTGRFSIWRVEKHSSNQAIDRPFLTEEEFS